MDTCDPAKLPFGFQHSQQQSLCVGNPPPCPTQIPRNLVPASPVAAFSHDLYPKNPATAQLGDLGGSIPTSPAQIPRNLVVSFPRFRFISRGLVFFLHPPLATREPRAPTAEVLELAKKFPTPFHIYHEDGFREVRAKQEENNTLSFGPLLFDRCHMPIFPPLGETSPSSGRFVVTFSWQ